MRLMLKRLSIVCLLLAVTACSSFSTKDSAPKAEDVIDKVPDIALIPNATPQDEPLSKYGNPASYEVFGKRYYTLKTSKGYHEQGTASWYGTKFHGKRTSSGEPYDMYAMTAAHKTLPLPSYVEVTNLDNGRKVIVKVNDRGPFHNDRLIDLSYTAATKLGIVGKGTGHVDIRAVSANSNTHAAEQVKDELPIPTIPATAAQAVSASPKASPASGVFLQVAAFSSEQNAQKLKQNIQSKTGEAVVISPLNKANSTLYRVRVGPLKNTEYGKSLASRLVDLGINGAYIVVE